MAQRKSTIDEAYPGDIVGLPDNEIGYILEDFIDEYKEALLVYLFKDISFRLGDTFLEYTDFSKSYFKYYDDLDDIIELALKDKYLIKKDSKYYLARDYYDEKFIANYLNRKKDNPFNVDDINIDIAIKDLEQFENIEYDLKQIKAIKNFFNFT